MSSDGIALSREFMPKLYDKHSLDRGKKISQAEREKKGIKDECFAYGEVDYEVFTTMFLKVTSVYGEFPNGGTFYDLGIACCCNTADNRLIILLFASNCSITYSFNFSCINAAVEAT